MFFLVFIKDFKTQISGNDNSLQKEWFYVHFIIPFVFSASSPSNALSW